MSRVALLCSEPLRADMAGIGIRYAELARRLPRPGIEVVLVGPVPGEAPELGVEVRPFAADRLPSLVADCDAAVAQGQLANDLLLACPELPVAIDLYDPWLVENLHYLESLGLDPYRNDHATWVLQMSRGDFFLCSSAEQRLYYLGFLTAVGRVHPHNVAADPTLSRLVAAVPFGLPEELPPHRPVLPARAPGGEARLLFGGLYDWYDPATLLAALERLEVLPWRLLFVAHPNPGGTPQALLAEVEARCRGRGWWHERVEVLPWVPAERRWDLLRDVDVIVAPHRAGIETELSMRTRFLDALAAGCPVVASEGGTVARLVGAAGAGWVVPPGDAAALAGALAEAVAGGETVAERIRRGRAIAAGFAWERVLAPLVEFCRHPWRDDGKDRFGLRPAVATPADPLVFRLRRRWRRLRGGGGGG